MSVVISGGSKLPSSRTSANDQESYEFDQSKIGLDSETNTNGVRNLVYLYNSGVGENAPLNIFQNTAVRSNSVRTEVSLSGPYFEADSVSGRTTALAKRSWGIWTIQPAGVLDLTAAVLQKDFECLVSLWRTSVASGVADALRFQQTLDAGRFW